MHNLLETIRKKINRKLLYATFAVIAISVLVNLFIYSSSDEINDDALLQNYFSQSYKIFALNIPKNLNFAEEKVPIQNFFVRENMDRELLTNTYWQSQTLLLIKRANRWFPLIEPILAKQGVPADFKYLALIESGFTNVVSPRGATGFWQLMKDAAEEGGLEISNDVDERYHIEKSTVAACRYLKTAYKKFGSWTAAAAAYNMGIDGYEKQTIRQHTGNYFHLLLNDETARYVFRILAVKEIIQNPKQYGFHLRTKDLYPSIATFDVEVDSAITDLAAFATNYNISYQILKLMNPWLRENYLSIKPDKVYKIKIPTPESLQTLLLDYGEEDETTFSPDSAFSDTVMPRAFGIKPPDSVMTLPDDSVSLHMR